jgi:hypothetical protein
VTWSGREALLAEWLPQFHNQEFARQEVDKYVRGSYAPDDTRASAWMERALLRDEDLAAVANEPEHYVNGPSRFDLNGCFHCLGRGFVRPAVDAHHPEFGYAKACPACRGLDDDRSAHCQNCADFSITDGDERNQCWKCRAFEDEAAVEGCTNPAWHLPNAAAGAVPTLKTMLRRF